MTRLIPSLVVAIICFAGCNDSTPPPGTGDDSSSTEEPVVAAGPPEHRMDLAGVAIPDAILKGTVNGKPIELHGVEATNTPEGTDRMTGLTFQLLGTVLTVSLPTSSTVHSDKKWETLKPSSDNVDYNHVVVGITGKAHYYNNFVIRLELGTPDNGKLPGGIYLCLPDEEKSFIAGRFEATVRSE